MTTNSFGYNGVGARVAKTDSGGTASVMRNGIGVTAPVIGDGSANFTPGISERRSSTTKHYSSDVKNTVAQVEASQTLSASKQYDAFGNVTNSSGPWNGSYSYGGKFGYQTEPDSGLMLLGHRYYDSSTGRFISRDPIEDGRNRFAYCAANPLKAADPTGLISFDEIEDGISNFFAGWGDSLTYGLNPILLGMNTSLTNVVRQALGVDDVVDYESGAYGAGGIVGMVHAIALDGAAAVSAAKGARSVLRPIAQGIEEEAPRYSIGRATRIGPKNLSEQIALKSAKSGVGRRIMDMLGDPMFSGGNWVKKAFVHKTPFGTKIEIHWFENVNTGAKVGYKFVD